MMIEYRSAVLFGIVVCASATWADTLDLPLTDDAYINGYNADWNYGAAADLFVHNYGPKQALVRFDAASVAAQSVGKATLTLYLNDIKRDGTISVHAITSGWNESTVTWNNSPPVEAAAAVVKPVTTGNEGSAITIDVTTTVRRWAEGSLPDAGFLLVTSDGIRAFFDSKEMAGGVAAALAVETGPAVSEERTVLDFTIADDCTIDEPGYYILDRSWDFSSSELQHACPENNMGVVRIETDGAVLDLQGYSLTSNDAVAIVYSGNYETDIRNGAIESLRYTLMGGRNGSVEISNMRFVGEVQIGGGTVSNSQFHASTLEIVGCDSTISCHDAVVRNCTFVCDTDVTFCVSISVREGSGLVRGEFRSNQIVTNGGGIEFNADSGIVASNVVDRQANPGLTNHGTGISIVGNRVTVAWNTITADSNTGEGIRIFGGPLASFTGSIVEANIIRGAMHGIFFDDTSGNYFGNNRVSATTPFLDDTGDQTDWGGNETF